MSDYERELAERKAQEQLKLKKVIKALALLDIKAKIGGEYKDQLDIEDLKEYPLQSFWIRVVHSKKKDTLEVSLSYSSPKFNYAYLNKDKWARIEATISINKTVEQIAADIKRRILNSPTAMSNEIYLQEVLDAENDYKIKKEDNRKFMSLSGLELEGKDSAEFYDYREGNRISINVKASSTLSYCEMKLEGLTKDEWLKVFEAIKPIVKG